MEYFLELQMVCSSNSIYVSAKNNIFEIQINKNKDVDIYLTYYNKF